MDIFSIEAESLSSVTSWAISSHLPDERHLWGIWRDRLSAHSVQILADQQHLYLKVNQSFKSIPLYSTVLEESLSLDKHRLLYELKLICQGLMVVLETYQEDLFIKFYCALATKCILKRFDKHYKIEWQIGSGASSTVWAARNIISNQEVAIKVLQKETLKIREQGYNYLINQIWVLGRLRELGLSPLLEVYETGDCIILVMIKAEKGSMSEYLNHANVVFNVSLVKNIMKQLLQNLRDLHQAGFIHRDVKPENILFTEEQGRDCLFLTDFGFTIHKSADNFPILNSRPSGTLGYMAPEIPLSSGDCTNKCDIFSAGCINYLLLNGTPLFQTDDLQEYLQKSRDQHYIDEKIADLGYKIQDKRAIQLLRQMLQTDPSQRINANSALNSSYFSQCETPGRLHLNPHSHEFGQYLQNRIGKFQFY